MRVTSRDVAERAGVSQSTVSRVLHNDPGVNPRLRKAVLDALEETGYIPNQLARSMRGTPTDSIGVVVDNLTNPYYQDLLNSLSKELTRCGQRLMVWVGQDGEEAALRASQERLIDGVVFATVSSGLLEFVQQQHIPAVLLNRINVRVQVDQVSANNEVAAYGIARYLITHDHKRLALIGGPHSASTARERERGFLRGCKDLGIGDVKCYNGEFSYEVAMTVARRLLEADFRPEAIFCVADLMAFATLDAAKLLRIRVPEDLWVVGFNGVPMSQWAAYDLTTAVQPVQDMVATGVEFLMSRIRNPGTPPRRQRLEAPLVTRGSTANAPLV